MARFGFTATELEWPGAPCAAFLENARQSRDPSPYGPLADEFIRNFLQGEPIPGIVCRVRAEPAVPAEIALAEIRRAREGMRRADRNRVVAIVAPEKSKAALPDAAKMTAVIAAASGGPLDAYVDTVGTAAAAGAAPLARAIATTSTNEPLGITEWRLSNGVRVVLKPTNFKEDEIVFRAVSPGGTSLARRPRLHPGGPADEVMCTRRYLASAAARSQQSSSRAAASR